MGGKSQIKNSNFNFINTSFDLEQFWNLENYGTLPKTHPNLLNKRSKKSGKYFRKHLRVCQKKISSRFVVEKDNPVFPCNRNLALRRLENLEKKFSKDQLSAKKYSETINSYISKGYAIKAHNVITFPITYFTKESLTNINQINQDLFLMPVPNIKVTV